MKKGILFDLDGTLWDSAEGVAVSWNQALARMGYGPRATKESVHAMMGKTMDVIACEFFPEEPREKAVQKMDLCLQMENEYLREHGGVLYEGLEATLKALRNHGWFLGIVSNCQEGYIEAFLESHGLGNYFDDTECFGHTQHGKGDNIRLATKRNGLNPVLYLGDTRGDYDAAGEAEIPFLHAAYGFGTVPEGTPKIMDIRDLPAWAEAFALDTEGIGL